ncbi:MAG: glycosyltransferase, partial [Bacteroidota bacterium]
MPQSRNDNKAQPGFADPYLTKSALGKAFIETPPDEKLKYIVVIPAYNESGLIKNLDSLFSCENIPDSIEILTVINCPWKSNNNVLQFNEKIREKAEKWAQLHNTDHKTFYIIRQNARNSKNSGVGFARKTGMDEAVRRFNKIGKANGFILSLDADVKVDRNYFRAINSHVRENPGTDGFNVYFEHPLEGKLREKTYEAIAQYELHLRYYVQALRYAGHPNAYHTVGSAFGVRADVYCQQGGMNKRQAGEDFYFLQKIFDLGNFSECNSTRIIPSPRPSTRVPFGTGPVVKNYLRESKELKTNHPFLFEILKGFLSEISLVYEGIKHSDFSFLNQLHPLLYNFLIQSNIAHKLIEIRN